MALLISSHAFSYSTYMDTSVVNTKYNKINNSKQNYKRANSFSSLKSSDNYDMNETLDNSIAETKYNFEDNAMAEIDYTSEDNSDAETDYAYYK